MIKQYNEKLSCFSVKISSSSIFLSLLTLSVVYDDLPIDLDLRTDLFVNDCIVVEIKAISNLLPVHQAQLLTYMKLLSAPQGLLINFFTDNITKSIIPMVNEYFKISPDR